MSATVFLVYRPVMDYEESMEPYFVCSSKEQAEAAEKRMCDYATRIAKRLPEYSKEEEEQDVDCSKFTEVEAKRREILNKAQWPFGINLQDDLKGFYSIEFDPSCVQVMPLSLVDPTPRPDTEHYEH